MPYDFSDPQDQERFRVSAISKGASINDANKYIAKRRSEQEISKYGISSEGKSLAPTAIETKTLPASEAVSLSDLDSASSQIDDLSKSLSSRQITGPIMGRLRSLNPYDTESRDVQAEIDTARQIVGRALEGGVLRKEDEEKYKKILPTMTDTQEVAQRKIENIKKLLNTKRSQATGLLQQAGYDAPESPNDFITGEAGPQDFIVDAQSARPEDFIKPNINMEGGLAEMGDLVRDPQSGKLQIQGDPFTETKRLKKAGNANVDTGLIKWLADSEALPFIGSVIGGVAGAGVGSIATGAAGAVAGKGMQQALRELIDPDQQDMSDMGKAILTEGMVDALFSAAGLGVIKGGGIVFKKIGTKLAGEAVEATGKEVTKSFLEKTAQKIVKGTPEDILRRTKAITPAKAGGFISTYGESVYKTLNETLDRSLLEITDADTLSKLASKTKGELGEQISKQLEGKFVDGESILKSLDDALEGIKVSGEEPLGIKPGKDAIEKAKKMITNSMDENGQVPANTAHKIKQTLRDAFKGQVDIPASAKGLKTTGYKTILNEIDKVTEGTYKDTNKKYYAAKLLEEGALKKVDSDQVKAALSLTDYVLGTGVGAVSPGAGIGLVALKKFMEKISSDPYVQMKIYKILVDASVSKGNKLTTRTLLRGLMDVPGVRFTIDPQLVREPAEAVMSQFVGGDQKEDTSGQFSLDGNPLY